jgi:hypothetical protein
MVRKLVNSALLGAVVLSGVIAPTAAEARCNDGVSRRINMVNNTSFTIRRMYGSNQKASTWQEDVLGDDVLGPGQSVVVNWDDNTCSCMFDFKVVYSDGDTSTKSGVNVCAVSTFTFNN